jgi:hypothetical protein
MAWTETEIRELKRLARPKDLFFTEIAQRIGRSVESTRHMARKLGIQYRLRDRFGEWNLKHKHLREAAMRYFLDHSSEETRKHFGLSQSELKSIFTVGYRDPKLKHLRKDTRRHDSWTTEELRFLISHAGVQPRDWIAKKLKRGTRESCKEALSRLKIGARYANGMPWSWAQEIFGAEAFERVIHMKAGPRGKSGHHGLAISRYRLIPWTECEKLLETGQTRRILGKGNCTPRRRSQAPRVQVHPEVAAGIRALAKFQRWIHGTGSDRVVRNQIETALRRR